MAKSGFVEKVIHSFHLDSEPLPRQPLLELLGDRRILIENHCGICEYGNERIVVRVRKGRIGINGKQLSLSFISRERLIITGCIEAVMLHRGQ